MLHDVLSASFIGIVYKVANNIVPCYVTVGKCFFLCNATSVP